MSKYQDSYFLKLQDHIANGSKDELTVEESDYEDLLFSVAGIIRREGKPAAMAWLKADKGCTRHVSERLCYEAINLFYATDYVRAEAWRNVLFEKMLIDLHIIDSRIRSTFLGIGKMEVCLVLLRLEMLRNDDDP